MTTGSERIQRIAVTLGVVALVGWWGAITFTINNREHDAILIDFVAFWAAAKLAVSGDAMAVWDPALFEIAQDAPREGDSKMPWFYPPTFHLVMTPFGTLPFSIAYGMFLLISVGGFWTMLNRIVPQATGLLLLSPAVCLTLMLGNNTLIFATCLMAALLWMDRPGRAGLTIAAMSLKPSLGPMIVPALLASGRWRVILWASIGTLALAGVATLAFGPEYWQEFRNGTRIAMNRIKPDAAETSRMISWYAFGRHFGLGTSTALALHLGTVAALAASIIALWSRTRTRSEWRAAVLALGVAMTSPHAFHYEMVFAVVALAFAFRAGLGPIGTIVAALLWLGPVVGIWPLRLVPLVSYAAPLLSLGVLYCTIRGLRD
ncbi:MAG: glycosyltransferase family 87 protein [Pseudomonadota bacterium]